MEYWQVQKIAKDTMIYAQQIIKPGLNLQQLRKDLERKMFELGADSFWYWDVGAFVFCGNETSISISGKQYNTSNKKIQENDIITIDLSPQIGNIWGDYARTFILENGEIAPIDAIENNEWRNGLKMEAFLHQELYKFITPQTTFEELYFYMNHVIEQNGFVNLDFSGNLGHSIAKQKSDRIYIEKGNQTKLSDVAYFTFEPHISIPKSKYGYKFENIYYFKNQVLMEL